MLNTEKKFSDVRRSVTDICMSFTTSYIIFHLSEGVAHGMSVFIMWIYNVDVVTITQRYKDLQEIWDYVEMVKNKTLFLSTKAFCKGSL